MKNSFSNFTYSQYVQQFLVIDEDSNGLYADVPGMSGDIFRVRVDESGLVPVATHCRCQHHKNNGSCLHTDIVDSFYARIYKTNIVRSNEKALEQAMNVAEAREEVEELVAIAEQIITTEKKSDTLTVPSAPLPLVMTKAENCKVLLDYRSAQTASFFMGLPSRQKAIAA